jgi:mono/diheme cytochrome c family protein
MVRLTCFLLALTLPLATSQGQAQGIVGQSAGQALAQRICAECHAVRRGEEQSPIRGAPTFERIADTSGMTSAALRVLLQTPHRAMPNVMLDQDELNDIVAHILSLRQGR